MAEGRSSQVLEWGHGAGPLKAVLLVLECGQGLRSSQNEQLLEPHGREEPGDQLTEGLALNSQCPGALASPQSSFGLFYLEVFPGDCHLKKSLRTKRKKKALKFEKHPHFTDGETEVQSKVAACMSLDVGPGLRTLRASWSCLSGDRGCSGPVWPSEDLEAYFHSSTTSSRAVMGSGQGASQIWC